MADSNYNSHPAYSFGHRGLKSCYLLILSPILTQIHDKVFPPNNMGEWEGRGSLNLDLVLQLSSSLGPRFRADVGNELLLFPGQAVSCGEEGMWLRECGEDHVVGKECMGDHTTCPHPLPLTFYSGSGP